jgi:hypothetical protein
MRRAGATLALVAVAGLTVAACSDDDSSNASASEATKDTATSTTAADDNMQSDTADEPATDTTIVDIAASNPDFSTLVTAVQAAGLTETLAGPGPYTVFAPTNERASFRRPPSRPCSNRPTGPTDDIGVSRRAGRSDGGGPPET